MPTQKVFKQRVRARMTKTGESYTTARSQLLRKSAPSEEPPIALPTAADAGETRAAPGSPTDDNDAAPATDAAPARDASDAAPARAPGSPTDVETPSPTRPDGSEPSTLVGDAAMRRATGRAHEEWFAILDAWGATRHTHPEIARWVRGTHDIEGWWAQNITVAYERARGMRGAGEMAHGFSITVSRTIDADPDTVLTAFTDPAIRARWAPGLSLTQRPSRASATRRFDWADPPSRVIVNTVARADGRTVVGVTHEQLPDSTAAGAMKASWRERLTALIRLLERAAR